MEGIEPSTRGLRVRCSTTELHVRTVLFVPALAYGLAGPPAPVEARPRDFTDETLRNGAGRGEVYRRPFVETWTGLAAGELLRTSIERGATRAAVLAETDVQLASRQSGFNQRGANGNIVGYRRVLTGSENCALCAIAATQRYTRGELKPIHPGCDSQPP